MIYFVTQSDEYVKIGYTLDNAKDRLINLQIGNPKELGLALVIEGDKSVEQVLHTRFASYHIRGEWFFLSNEIKTFIRKEKQLKEKESEFDPIILDEHRRVVAILNR